MKVLLLALFCSATLSASAQIWPFAKHKRYPLIAGVQSKPFVLPAAQLKAGKVSRVEMGPTHHSLKLTEHMVMKTAQHQMRFREYENASYSFNELAKVYVQLNQLSQAKWFFLQSNNLSRQQNNDRLTIANLVELASVKSAIGDFALAQQDLEEARSMAVAHNWQDDMQSVSKHLDLLQRSKIAALKPEAGISTVNQAAL